MGKLLVGLLTLCAIAGCSRDLGRREAARLVHAHLASVAPAGSLDSTRIEVVEILTLDDHSRDVRFDAVVTYQDSLGRSAEARPTGFNAQFQRSDRGWALVRYGPKMAEAVAGLVAAKREEPISELRTTVILLGIKLEKWLEGQPAGASAHASLLEQIASDLNLADTLRWGVTPPVYQGAAQVVWAASSDSARVCAEQLGDGYGSAEFHWVGERGVHCRERGGYRFESIWHADSVLAEINRNGGFLRPAGQ